MRITNRASRPSIHRFLIRAALSCTCATIFVHSDLTHAQSEPAPTITDEQAARSYFSDLPLITQDGKQVRFFTDLLRGHVVLISSFYTSCHGVSPRQGQVLAELQELLGDTLGKKVFIVSITVDPEKDTLETVSEYAKQFGPRTGWVFLTGKAENIDSINQKLGQKLDDLEEHKGTYMLGNVDTALWMKVPFHAMASDLYFQIKRLLQDERHEPGA